MSRRTILLDSDMIGHQAIYAMENVDLSKDDYKTEIIYNFLSRIKKLAEDLETPDFIFCWDSPTSSLERKKLYPGYKESRDWDKKTFEEQELLKKGRKQFVKLRQHILPAMGFNNILWAKGYESDDLMASIIDDHASEDEKFIMVTADKDMYQMLKLGVVSMFDPDPRRYKKFTASNFQEKYGIEPGQWVDVKILGGCQSDTVAGIEGVGEITAIKFLQGILPNHYKTYDKIMHNKDEIYKQNDVLVRLPFYTTPHDDLYEDEITEAKFLEIFNQFGFKSFTNRMEDWKRTFKI